MINNKNFIYYFVPYLTVSCGLYHIVYWGCFGLNGLSIISVENIIKTAIASIVLTFLISLLGYYVTHKIFNRNFQVEKLKDKKYLIIQSIGLCIIYSIIYYLITLVTKSNSFELGAFFLSLIIVDWIEEDYIFEKSFKTIINKEICLLMLISFPLNSIGTALSDSSDILNNSKYMYSVKIDNLKNDCSVKIDTMKLIGINNDNFIFTDLKNEKIYFIKNDTIQLFKK